MDAAISLHWEFMGHGLTNSITLRGMPREQEASVIAQTRGNHRRLRPEDVWLARTQPGGNGRYAQSAARRGRRVRRRLGQRRSAVSHEQWALFDPYTLELNEMPLFNMPSIAIEEVYRRICETIDVLYDEGAAGGRVMCIALHPFLIRGAAPH
jgi:hypothetical protein